MGSYRIYKKVNEQYKMIEAQGIFQLSPRKLRELQQEENLK